MAKLSPRYLHLLHKVVQHKRCTFWLVRPVKSTGRNRQEHQSRAKCGLRGMQATSKGIHVSNIPSEGTGNALSCAEMAIYLTLACLRSAPSMADSIRHGRVGVPLGQTLYGKRILIVGFGGIAKELIPRCVATASCVDCAAGALLPPVVDLLSFGLQAPFTTTFVGVAATAPASSQDRHPANSSTVHHSPDSDVGCLAAG